MSAESRAVIFEAGFARAQSENRLLKRRIRALRSALRLMCNAERVEHVWKGARQALAADKRKARKSKR